MKRRFRNQPSELSYALCATQCKLGSGFQAEIVDGFLDASLM